MPVGGKVDSSYLWTKMSSTKHLREIDPPISQRGIRWSIIRLRYLDTILVTYLKTKKNKSVIQAQKKCKLIRISIKKVIKHIQLGILPKTIGRKKYIQTTSMLITKCYKTNKKFNSSQDRLLIQPSMKMMNNLRLRILTFLITLIHLI